MKEATLRQGSKVLDLILQKEVPSEQLQKLLGSGLLYDLLDADVDKVDREAFRQVIGLKPQNTYSITVNYDRFIEDAVRAGNYHWKNSNINSKNFSTKKSGIAEVDVELVHFNRNLSAEEAPIKLNKQGQRPAEIHELLALGEKYTDLQKEFPIIAFGSVWQDLDGRPVCACLTVDGDYRTLFLYWVGHGWDVSCRFAVVCK